MAGKKPPRIAHTLRPAVAATAPADPAVVQRFIEGGDDVRAPQEGDGRGRMRWSNGTEARKHSVYLPVELSEDLLKACREDGVKASKAFEQAVELWLDVRGKGR